MDPKMKNARQPFVYYTNKAVTKERERHFPSSFEASFSVSCLLDPFVNFIVALTCPHHDIFHAKIRKVKIKISLSCRLLLVFSFSFPPVSQSDTSFRSSPSALASVGHKLLQKTSSDLKTRTKTRTTTTTNTRTT